MSIKLSAFLTAYKFRKSDDEKEEIIKKHILNEYVPFEKKADVAKAIVETSYHQKIKDKYGNERTVLHVDSVGKFMLTCMAMLDLFTDIERSKGDGKMLEEFNALNSLGIFDMIINNLDQRELKEFNMVLQLTSDDFMTNEYENHAFITEQVERFGELIGATLSPVLAQLDTDKIEEIIDKFK